ncbi:MAG: HD domain-containing protein, partial [archaeon]
MERGETRTINDPVHGHITLTPLQEKLLETPEVQRLSWVRQLGLTKLVYPGANNTRLEHSLGVSFIAGEIADHLGLSEDEKNLVQATGMLHDIGHAPFSHTLEPLLPFDHMVFTGELITGKKKMPFPNAGRIPSILEDFGVKPKEVADLVNKKYSGKKYVQQI